MSVHVNILFG